MTVSLSATRTWWYMNTLLTRPAFLRPYGSDAEPFCALSDLSGLEMALASGHWVEKETDGMPPSPRSGHAVAVAGNVAFLHGGVSNANSEKAQPEYFNDFHMITVSSSCITWETMPQNGVVPTAREGHTLCVVGGKIYLFGGSCHPEAKECLPGVYCFDVVTLRWEKLDTRGVALKTLRHSWAALGDNIYVYGGILDGTPRDVLMMFNTVSLIWTPIKTMGTPPSARYHHACAVVNEQIFLFGGCDAEGSYHKDIHVLNIETLTWQRSEVKGESPLSCAGQTFTAHHDKVRRYNLKATIMYKKDIYLFGGAIQSSAGKISSTNEIHKLSLAKMKWKVPLYVGIPPVGRHGHATFIIHGHMYVFGGRNEEQDFNDLKIMRLINPSERQPVMKEILSEFGLQGVSNSFVPTKIPNVRYELGETPVTARTEKTQSAPQNTAYRDFTTVRAEALTRIHQAFAILDEQFQKLDREKSDLSEAVEALRCERQAINEYHQKQSQELQKMLERHRVQNEAWLRARAEENDKERKELFKLREEVLHEQERLKEEQCNIQKRSEHLLSIMQQFKGM